MSSNFSGFGQFSNNQLNLNNSTAANSSEKRSEEDDGDNVTAPFNGFGFGFTAPATASLKPIEPTEFGASDSTPSISSGFDFFIKSPEVEEDSSKAEEVGDAPIDGEPLDSAPIQVPAIPTVDSDSFLAEPSISVNHFDQIVFPNTVAPSVPEELASPKSTSTIPSVPQLIEELEPTPQFLEEPPAHSIDDIQKAHADFCDESWENIDEEDIIAVIEAKTEPEAKLPVPTELEPEAPVPPKKSAKASPVKAPVVKASPVKASAVKASPVKAPAVKASPVKAPTAKASPVKAPTAKASPVKASAAKASPAKASHAKRNVTEVADTVETTRHSKRERKTVERLSEITPKSSTAAASAVTIPNGSGTKLGDIEVISKAINSKLASHKLVILLHRIIFDRMGDARSRKSNLRAFCGTESKEAAKTIETKLLKLSAAELREIAALLSLINYGEKAALSSRITSFLASPSMEVIQAKKETTPKPKPKASTRAKAKPPAKKRASSTKATGETKSSSSKAAAATYLTPETVESDIDSDTEREVLQEIESSDE